MTTDAQVVIVGGGIMGVSLVWRLTARGWRDVVLQEKSELTAGSTWHAAGLCTHFAHNPTVMEMRPASVRLYRDVLPAETGESAGFHPCGALRVTRSAASGDFTRTGTTLTVAAGATTSTGKVTVRANDNTVASGTAAGGHGVAYPADATLTLTDDDTPQTTLHLSSSIGESGGVREIETVGASGYIRLRCRDRRTTIPFRPGATAQGDRAAARVAVPRGTP